MKIKKILIIMFTSLILVNISYGNDVKTLSDKKGFELYQERVSLFCSEYKINDNTSEMIYLIDKENQFLNLDDSSSIKGKFQKGKELELASNQYKKNLDEIYGCATNIVYYRSLKLVKEDLINKTPKLNSKLQNKLDSKIKEIESKINSTNDKCKITGEKNNSIIKKSVLKQTTYELCKYNFYLEYLKEFSENISTLDNNTINNKDNSKAISEILKEEKTKKDKINKEISNINRVFPIAFKAYSEYENNITAHILLDLLREDYIILRDSLHKNLNPINQVVYKISNAMKK